MFKINAIGRSAFQQQNLKLNSKFYRQLVKGDQSEAWQPQDEIIDPNIKNYKLQIKNA